MSEAITLFNPQALEHLEKMAGTLAKSSLIPDALRGKPGDVLVTLMTGAELGLHPMQSLRSIAVVKGKPSLSADLMVSLVKQRKDVCEHLVLVKSTPEIATYRAKRVGEPEPTEMSFTMQDAQRAGLTAPGGMYSKYPAQMLRARAASGICRAVFPDLCMGLYDSDSGELTDGRPLPEKDITPPKRGLEAIPSLKQPETVEPPKALPSNTQVALAASIVLYKKQPITEMAEEALQAAVMELEAWLAKPASARNPGRSQTEARLSAIIAELATRKPVEREPGQDDETAWEQTDAGGAA